MTTIPGSDLLTSALHIISQSLVLPVTIFLFLVMAYAIIELGGLLAEYFGRITIEPDEIESLLNGFAENKNPTKIIELVNSSNLPDNYKIILSKIAGNNVMDGKSREIFARKLIEHEEARASKSLEKTDIIAKIAPAIGLMGTLIPLGPGLEALGNGDITTLAQHLTTAFDAAITGLAAASIGFTISKVRRRWYEDQISTLDALAESILEVLK
jgi:biopolymer transport protein ExbB/TolQ